MRGRADHRALVADRVAVAVGEDLYHLDRGAFAELSVRVEWPDVAGCGAEVVLVAPCGYHLDADAYVVRPGPRVVAGVEAIASILHPHRAGPPDPAAARRIR